MKRPLKYKAIVLLGVVGLAANACGPEPANPEDITESSADLAKEIPNGVAEQITKYYRKDPDVAFTSYGIPNLNNCSASMIGPNTMMTAAHCGPKDATQIRFRTYRNGDLTKLDSELFDCSYLLQTFPDTDLALYHCDNNAAGESPGQKYGYLDFDVSTKLVADPKGVGGTKVYSIWTNTIAAPNISKARIYSEGTVTSTTEEGWYTPGGKGDEGDAIGVKTTTWNYYGASGSPQLNPANHRIVIGPTSTCPSCDKTDGTEAPDRRALSIRDYLKYGAVSTTKDTAINKSRLLALGLNPNEFYGSVDKDKNNLFDVQEKLEKLEGEPQRAWTWLGFDSERRNALWDKWAGATFQPSTKSVRLKRTTAGKSVLLDHPRLNLKSNKNYRVTLRTSTASAATTFGLEIYFVEEKGPFGTVASTKVLPTVAGAGWKTHSFTLKTGVGKNKIRFEINGPIDITLAALSLIEEDATMDFDSFDKRAKWRNEATGARGSIVPDGKASSGTPNFAGRVDRPAGTTTWSHWSLRNRQLAIVPDAAYEICFDARRDPVDPLAAGFFGEVMLKSNGVSKAWKAFSVSDAWQPVCLKTTAILKSGDNNLMFGVKLGSASTSKGGSYLVDNVTIKKKS